MATTNCHADLHRSLSSLLHESHHGRNQSRSLPKHIARYLQRLKGGAHAFGIARLKTIVVALLAIPMAAYLLIAYGYEGQHELLDKLKEFVSFIILLGALYSISGGIYVKGSLSGTAPRTQACWPLAPCWPISSARRAPRCC